VVLPEQIAHHVQVLRLQPGDTITLFNGEGGEYTASLSAIEKKRATPNQGLFPARSRAALRPDPGPGPARGSKMDWIIEKAVELGATALQPLAAQRCVVRLSAERAEKKQAHWQGIIHAAAEQCGRNRLPHLAEVPTSSAGSPRATCTGASCSRAASSAPLGAPPPPQAVTLVVGPKAASARKKKTWPAPGRADAVHGQPRAAPRPPGWPPGRPECGVGRTAISG
jgi:16S rRNA (uracil1498-N3)-methyltransferase